MKTIIFILFAVINLTAQTYKYTPIDTSYILTEVNLKIDLFNVNTLVITDDETGRIDSLPVITSEDSALLLFYDNGSSNVLVVLVPNREGVLLLFENGVSYYFINPRMKRILVSLIDYHSL